MIINSNRMNFAEVVQELLGEYGDSVVHAMTEVIPEVGKEAAKRLKQTSPKGATGKYRRSWRSMAEKERIRVGATVYAEAPGYRIAHLLEYGHAKRGGGRTAAIEHIKPIEEWAIKEAEDRIIDKLEREMR